MQGLDDIVLLMFKKAFRKGKPLINFNSNLLKNYSAAWG